MYGGGPGPDDRIVATSGKSNCTDLCIWAQTIGAFAACCPGYTAYFARCYNAESATPLNKRRVSFVSQMGTTAVDPSLPANMGVANATISCIRRLLIYILNSNLFHS